MKTLNCFFLLLACSFFAYSQQEIKIDEMSKAMSKGSQNAYLTEIPQAKLKDVISDWKKFVKHETKNNIENINNEISIKGTILSNISTNPISVYAYILETEQSIRLTAFFSEDDSIFISSTSSETKSMAIKKFLHDFAVQEYKDAVNNELKAENKKLSKLQDDLDDIIKSSDKATKRISEDNRKIDNNKDEIIATRKEQEARAADVANQKEAVRSVASLTGSEQKDLETKKLKDLEKEKKKLDKKNENLHSDNDDLASDIKKQERTIEENSDLQKAKKEEITAQKEVIRNVEKKALGIH